MTNSRKLTEFEISEILAALEILKTCYSSDTRRHKKIEKLYNDLAYTPKILVGLYPKQELGKTMGNQVNPPTNISDISEKSRKKSDRLEALANILAHYRGCIVGGIDSEEIDIEFPNLMKAVAFLSVMEWEPFARITKPESHKHFDHIVVITLKNWNSLITEYNQSK